jgi:multidrug transporter EmrE-like cation transporter
VQAVYISTPGGVIFGVFLFKDHADLWLVASLALVMAALVCNNRAVKRLAKA